MAGYARVVVVRSRDGQRSGRRVGGLDNVETENHRAYLYHPLVNEAECVRAESRSFLSRVYGGALLPMLAHFIEEENLSPEEIEELRRILAERGR